MIRSKWLICALASGIATFPGLWGRQSAPVTRPLQSAPLPGQTGANPTSEFTREADEVLAQMSQILVLPIKEPLKKDPPFQGGDSQLSDPRG